MKSFCGAFAILLALNSVAHANLLTLNPTADLRILSFDPITNDNHEGLATLNASGNIQRTLIQFDLSTISGATINSATLRLSGQSFSGSTAATTIDLFRVTAPWSETTATWNSRSTGNTWTNAGGDAVGTTGTQLANPYAHFAGNETTSPAWFEFNATALVAGSANGTFTNNGWLLTAPLGNTLIFASREGFNLGHPALTEIPQLVVDFTPAPEPASLAILSLGILPLLKRRRPTSSATKCSLHQ